MQKKVKPAKKSGSNLPQGFRAIVGGGGESWKPTAKGATLIGVLSASKVVKFPKKGKMPAREVTIFTIKTKDGTHDVWESAGLRALHKIKKGKPVYIQYLGLRRIKKGQNPMRDYVVATK